MVLGFAVILALMPPGVAILFHPLTVNLQTGDLSINRLLLGGLLSIPFALVMVGLIAQSKWKSFLAMLLLGTLGVLAWNSTFEPRAALDAKPVLEFLETRRQEALVCMNKADELHSPYRYCGKRSSSQCRHICYSSNATWRFEGENADFSFNPVGWRYLDAGDYDASDDTFAFGMINVTGQKISCTHNACKTEGVNSVVALPHLSSTLGAAATFEGYVLAHDDQITAGERVSVMRFTLTNSGSTPIDFGALWLRRIGNASPDTLAMVYVADGDGTYGASFRMLPPSVGHDDGTVYIQQPGMFAVMPGESRSYELYIEAGKDAQTEAGKMVGIEALGFSYAEPVPGFPMTGTVYKVKDAAFQGSYSDRY